MTDVPQQPVPTEASSTGLAPPDVGASPPPPPPPPPPPQAPPISGYEAAPPAASGLPPGVTLTNPARRLGQYLLDILLFIVTLGIGWIVWSLIVWSRGQTPGMQVLHIRAVKLSTGQTATWGTMFLREFVAKGLIMGVISSVFFPAWVVLAFMLLWDDKNQELWDKIAGTIVVNDEDSA